MNVTETLIKGCTNPKVAKRRAAELVSDVCNEETGSYWRYRATAKLADALGAVAAEGGGFAELHAALLGAPSGDPVEVCVQATALAAVALHAADGEPGAPR